MGKRQPLEPAPFLALEPSSGRSGFRLQYLPAAREGDPLRALVTQRDRVGTKRRLSVCSVPFKL